MNDFIDKLNTIYKNGTEGIKIIYLCVISSVVYWIINFISFKLFNFSLDSLFLLSADSFFPYIWTIFTFPLIHKDLLELLFAMIMLFFSERLFKIYFNGKSFIKFFFLGNILGGIVFLVLGFVTGYRFSYLHGVLPGVYGVLFAVISYNPKTPVSLFPIPLQFPIYILGLILIGLDLLNLLGNRQSISLFTSHLGAAAFGYFYMKSFQTGNDFLGKFVPDSQLISKLFSFFKIQSTPHFKSKQRGHQQNYRPKTDEEFNLQKKDKQKRINQILDKISKNGYESLTKEEKDFLFKSSK